KISTSPPSCRRSSNLPTPIAVIPPTGDRCPGANVLLGHSKPCGHGSGLPCRPERSEGSALSGADAEAQTLQPRIVAITIRLKIVRRLRKKSTGPEELFSPRRVRSSWRPDTVTEGVREDSRTYPSRPPGKLPWI